MLNYLSSQNKNKNPLVFIHGIGSTSKVFQKQIKEFGKKYYTISLDLPGYGKSKTIESVTIENYANAVYNFLESINEFIFFKTFLKRPFLKRFTALCLRIFLTLLIADFKFAIGAMV